jgi:uncharacterized protein (TIGR02271 family)
MPLFKIKDFDPNYRDHMEGGDIKNLDLYSGTDKVGSVDDVLVDEEGRFRYLVISTGAWIFGKKVLLPVGRARVDYNDRRVYADGLSKEQVENLPELSDDMKLDYDYEEQVRGVYRPSSTAAASTANAQLESTAPLDPGVSTNAAYTASTAGSASSAYDRDSYRYDMDPDLYQMDANRHQPLNLYEERLIAGKRREKTGEVAIGKHVETETQHVSVPIERERVVIERTPVSGDTRVAPGEIDLQEGEVARVEVYEETPDIRKEAFVREQVNVRKVVDRDTVEADEQVRREELDIDTQGNPVIDRTSDNLKTDRR